MCRVSGEEMGRTSGREGQNLSESDRPHFGGIRWAALQELVRHTPVRHAAALYAPLSIELVMADTGVALAARGRQLPGELGATPERDVDAP